MNIILKQCIIYSFVLAISNVTYTNDLDRLAVKYGTDKSSKGHNFTAIYEKYFSALRNEKINLLEIGIDQCCSAFLWDEYFPNAHLYFIDGVYQHVNKGNSLLSERAKCFVCDQGKRDQLADFINKTGVEFDIIIDDGGHVSQLQITSFEMLFPHVKKGGMYIIEDLNYSYWQGSGGSGSKASPKSEPESAIQYLKNLIDELNYIPATDGNASIDNYPRCKREKLNYYQEHIESMHFYPSLCIIFKR